MNRETGLRPIHFLQLVALLVILANTKTLFDAVPRFVYSNAALASQLAGQANGEGVYKFAIFLQSFLLCLIGLSIIRGSLRIMRAWRPTRTDAPAMPPTDRDRAAEQRSAAPAPSRRAYRQIEPQRRPATPSSSATRTAPLSDARTTVKAVLAGRQPVVSRRRNSSAAWVLLLAGALLAGLFFSSR